MSPDVYHSSLNRLPDPLPILPLPRPFDATIRPPGSKSITNRALLLAALARGTSELRGALVDADDAQVMIHALVQLGAVIDIAESAVRITGVAGRWKIPPGASVRLDLHNAGTATRFLTAAALLAPPGTSVIIDGDARMRERPIRELVDALTSIGGVAVYEGRPGFPPVRVHAPTSGTPLADTVTFGTTASSQFISAMVLVAPFLPRGLRVRARSPITSAEYVAMSVAMLHDRGVRLLPADPDESHREGFAGDWTIPHTIVEGASHAIPPDASGATYFQAAAAICPGSRVTIPDLSAHQDGMQEDARFPLMLEEMGAQFTGDDDQIIMSGSGTLRAVEYELDSMPDAAMTAAAAAFFARPTPDNPTATSTFSGLRTLRVKETDRLEALRTELSKIGAVVEIYAYAEDGEDDEGLRITPPPALGDAPVHFDTYNDHRMAMALALIGLRRPNVFIRNPACVAKTYPTYWRDFAKLYER